MDGALELAVRQAAFDYLRSVVDEDGVASWRQLHAFTYLGEPVVLASQNGIFKPKQLDLPISIRAAPPTDNQKAPYDDEVSEDDYLLYKYRGRDPNHADNVGLRNLKLEGLPLLYLHGVDKARYLVSVASIVDDDPGSLTFKAVLARLRSSQNDLSLTGMSDYQRSEEFRLIRERRHQASFRTRVLRAYKTSCSICRIKHAELLDAAHIIQHSEGGPPIVPNGLALCKIHHAAYDANIIGIRPDLVTVVREDILAEHDGPMLAHGLQDFHETSIWTPRSRNSAPDRDALESRYEKFEAAS